MPRRLRALDREVTILGGSVPLVVLVLVFQQRIVAGLTAGAVKG